MRFRLFAITAVLCAAGVSAHADSFKFSFGTSTSAFSGSGTLTTGAAEAPGEYLITAVTGTAETSPNGANLTITSLLQPGVFPTPTNGNSFPANDNTLFFANGLGTLSQDGVSFVLQNGAQINLFNGGTGNDAFLERTNGNTVSEMVPITITSATPLATTPEPSSFLLLGTGLLSVAGVMRRRIA